MCEVESQMSNARENEALLLHAESKAKAQGMFDTTISATSSAAKTVWRWAMAKPQNNTLAQRLKNDKKMTLQLAVMHVFLGACLLYLGIDELTKSSTRYPFANAVIVCITWAGLLVIVGTFCLVGSLRPICWPYWYGVAISHILLNLFAAGTCAVGVVFLGAHVLSNPPKGASPAVPFGNSTAGDLVLGNASLLHENSTSGYRSANVDCSFCSKCESYTCVLGQVVGMLVYFGATFLYLVVSIIFFIARSSCFSDVLRENAKIIEAEKQVGSLRAFSANISGGQSTVDDPGNAKAISCCEKYPPTLLVAKKRSEGATAAKHLRRSST